MAVSTVTASTTADATQSVLSKTAVDFNMFLKLLTTQMQNQDPLKPMDSTEYTQQLAQFSQVEQTLKQTGTLNDILSALSTQGIAQASGFIGRTATFDSAVSGHSADTPANWGISAPVGTTSLVATISDASGKAVAKQTLSPSDTSFKWDGKTTAGTDAPAGAYTLSLTALDAGGKALTPKITTTGKIGEVNSLDGNLSLGVNGAQQSMGKLMRLSEG